MIKLFEIPCGWILCRLTGLYLRLGSTQVIQFGAHKLPLRPGASREERVRHTRHMLHRVLNMQTTVAVVGTGCTIPLGYPTWQEFTTELVERTAAGLRNLPAEERIRLRVERFEGFLQRLSSPAPVTAQSLMFYITACQRALRSEKWDKDPYLGYMEQRFSAPRKPLEGLDNPCESLLDLPIYRFVTTNYDCEVERALAKRRGVPLWKLGLGRQRTKGATSTSSLLSFTQESRYSEQQITFALARGGENKNMVFHCHGRYDEIDSIVASEADYQRWYVSDREDSGFFRQTMDLLFRFNPLLFVGYGLREEDLLQPLRELGAIDPARKDTRPIFALLPARGTDEDEHRTDFLFERFGLHVIPYTEPSGADAQARGAALGEALRDLKRDWDSARDEWVCKPFVRSPRVDVSTKVPLLIPQLDPVSLRQFAEIPVPDRLDEILANIMEGRSKVIGLVGSSGTGKSSHLIRLIEQLQVVQHRFHGVFYWNAHYSNEALTALDLALDYLDPDFRTEGARKDRLLQCMTELPLLMIIDGCERLLRPGDRPGEGRAFGSGFRKILRLVLAEQSQSTVVLSGRLWPSELTVFEKSNPKIHRILLDRVRAADLARCPPFDMLPRSQVSALVSLLNGHSYGLLLSGRYLARAEDRKIEERCRELERKLAARSPRKRVGAMIDYLLNDLEPRTNLLGREFLEQISLFLEPVLEPTLQACFEQVCQDRDISPSRERYDAVLGQLVSDGLLVGIQTMEPRALAYAAHPTIRDHLGRSEYVDRRGSLPDFALSAFTAGTHGVDPGSDERKSRIQRLFDRLMEEIRIARTRDLQEQARNLGRDAYSLLRSHTEASTAGRCGNYDDYTKPEIRLASLIQELSGRTWTYCDPNDLREVESPQAPLYIGELSWLYNDVGVALFSEGLMQDAYAVWEQGYEINRVLTPHGEFALESLFNLTHVLIELGQVSDAEVYLKRTERLNIRLRDREVEGRIHGYKGFLEHIEGNLESADRLYHRCLRRVRRTGNYRAMSFFLTLQASLKVELGELEDARSLIRSSRAAAEAGGYPDLVAYSRLPDADLMAKQGDLTAARLGLNAARREAQGLRARALEALILFKLGDLSLAQGDFEGARRLATQSLGLANELGLGLISTRALMVLARAMIQAGQRSLGMTYLRIVKQRSQTQGYGLRLREVERYLQDEDTPRAPTAEEAL